MSKPQVTIYSKPRCVQCEATKKAFHRIDVDFLEVNLNENLEALATVKSLGYAQAPIVTLTQEETIIQHWSGYRPDLIKQVKEKVNIGLKSRSTWQSTTSRI